uniref:helix-turn-helix domain-containing protein n=1 Tax=Hafnia alvei TaxID=569 RepID=UPI00242AFAA1|nr:helix-turn-helix domain-containing protein [Hafnia alvei]
MKENTEIIQYEASARRIKQILYEKGWSKSKLARELGVSAQAVQQWERGITRPNGPNLLRLSEVSGKPEHWFLSSDDSNPPNAVVMQSEISDLSGLSEDEQRLIRLFRLFPEKESRNMLAAFEMRFKELQEYYDKYVNPNPHKN